jgi:hypothetical protein
MSAAVQVVLLLVAWLLPLPVGYWAYRRSNLLVLLAIPATVTLVPLVAVATLMPLIWTVGMVSGPALWLYRIPSLVTMAVLIESVRRLEGRLT